MLSRVFLLKRQKVLQQQERDSIKKTKITKLISSVFHFPQSLNGVWLNRARLEPLRVYSIHQGDYIQLGVPLENKENAEYEYEVTEEDWETIYPCLSPKNDQMIEKNKELRTKRKFSLDQLGSPGAEGPSNLKSKINKVSCESSQSVKSQGKGEVASTPSENLDPKLTALEPSKNTGAPIYPGFPIVTEVHHEQKASNSSASQRSLQMFKVTMSRILRLKIQMQEKHEAVMNVKRQTQKGNSKKIVRMEQELQDLQSQLCAEQAQQQARVEQLEKTFQEEEQHLQVPHRREGQEWSSGVGQALHEPLARVLSFWARYQILSTKDKKWNGNSKLLRSGKGD